MNVLLRQGKSVERTGHYSGQRPNEVYFTPKLAHFLINMFMDFYFQRSYIYTHVITDLLKLRDVTILPLVFTALLKGGKTKQNALSPEPKLQLYLNHPLLHQVPSLVQG